jgi:uncharacterized protein YdhG (YjbR/CyaY superfamily)
MTVDPGGTMASDEVDGYLAALDEPKRSTLETMRRLIAAEIPEAEEGLSYGVPVFRIEGKPIAGFSAAKQHLSYLPHSGSILGSLDADQLQGFTATKGAVKMAVDTPLPAALIRILIVLRRAEAGV